MKKLLILTALIALHGSPVWAKCIVNTDCTFEYVPVAIADGYSRDATLTLVTPSDIDIFYKFDDASAWTTAASESETCPPTSGVCMTQISTTGTYRIIVDASVITAANVNKRLCVDVRDVQGTRTVPNEVICQDVVYPFEGHTYCDISAATSTTSFTLAACFDSVGTSITLADNKWSGTIWRFYTNGTSPCNVIDEKFYLYSMTNGLVVAGSGGKLKPTVIPDINNCGVTNP